MIKELPGVTRAPRILAPHGPGRAYRLYIGYPRRPQMRRQPLHPLLFLLARATQPELIRQVQFLNVENRILRSRLPSGWW